MIITIDFESYWSKDFTLKKLSETDYILSPLFQSIMCAIKLGDKPAQVYVGDAQIRKALSEIDWANAALLSHNTRFDGAILAWRYGVTPRLYLDTLSMARAVTHIYTGSSSLAKVAAHLGLPAKGDAVNRAMGKRLEDFTDVELAEYAEYCAHDAELCHGIFTRFRNDGFPASELHVIDLILRMFIEPQARLNKFKLAEHLQRVEAEQRACFERVAYLDKSIFSSNQKFAALLEEQGVKVPMKISPTTGETTYALAKGDWEFKELLADDTLPMLVQTLLACRVNAKSTGEVTRTRTMLNLAHREIDMPVPYRYYGALTGRLSGDGGFNFANLKRGSPIRDAIEAPDGMRIVHRDSSQIEARVVAWLAGCKALVSAFAEGRDVYCEFGSKLYNRTITKEDVTSRFTAKTAVLSLGYNAGSKRFRHALFIGTGGVSVRLELHQAQTIVDLYRSTYAEIPALWRRMHDLIGKMVRRIPEHYPEPGETNVSPVLNFFYTKGTIELPNRMMLRYPNLREYADGYVYDGAYANEKGKKIYGGKLTENIVQALARIIVTDAMRAVYYETGRHPIMSTYDSLDYVVPEGEAREFDELLARAFAVVPAWCEGLPLASEGGWGMTLLEAEKGVNQ